MPERTWHPGSPAWRISTINLDDNENLLSVTVVVQTPAIDRVESKSSGVNDPNVTLHDRRELDLYQ